MSSFSADLSLCSQRIQTDVAKIQLLINDLDDSDKYSEQMIDILSHSLIGFIVAAPSCDALKNLSKDYKIAIKDLK